MFNYFQFSKFIKWAEHIGCVSHHYFVGLLFYKLVTSIVLCCEGTSVLINSVDHSHLQYGQVQVSVFSIYLKTISRTTFRIYQLWMRVYSFAQSLWQICKWPSIWIDKYSSTNILGDLLYVTWSSVCDHPESLFLRWDKNWLYCPFTDCVLF
jgi:hypothetical protein